MTARPNLYLVSPADPFTLDRRTAAEPRAMADTHLPLLAGEVFELRRPPRWMARIVGLAAFVGALAVLMAIGVKG